MGGQGGIRPISLQEYARFPLRNPFRNPFRNCVPAGALKASMGIPEMSCPMGGQGGIRPELAPRIPLQEPLQSEGSLGSLHGIPEDRPVTLDGPRIPLQESLQEFDLDSASRNPGNELPYGWARGNTPDVPLRSPLRNPFSNHARCPHQESLQVCQISLQEALQVAHQV